MENYDELLTENELNHVTNEDLFQEIKDYKQEYRENEINKRLQEWINKEEEKATQEAIDKKKNELENSVKINWNNSTMILTVLEKIEYFKFITFKEINTDTNKVPYWYDWDKGAYTRDVGFMNKIINHFYKFLSSRLRKEIIEQLSANAEEKELDNTRRYIVFNNGTYDSQEKQFIPYHKHSVYVNRACPYNYHKEVTIPHYSVKNVEGNMIDWTPHIIVEAFKNGDDKREKLFWQLLRAILSPNSCNHVFCYAYNEEGNGAKSTIGELFKSLAGDYKNMNLSGLGQRFALVGIEKVPLIYGDDNDTKSILKGLAMELFKSITQGIAVPIEEKNKPIYEGTFHGVWWQSSNAPMQFNDFNGSLDRRVILLPFKQIPKEQRSTAILSDIIKRSEVIEWFISETIKREPEAVQAFTKPKDNARQLEQLKEDNDPYSAFFSECIEPLMSMMNVIPIEFVSILAKSYGENVDPYFLTQSRKAIKQGIMLHMEKHSYYYKKQSRLPQEIREYLLSFERDKEDKSTLGIIVSKFRYAVKEKNYTGIFIKGAL